MSRSSGQLNALIAVGGLSLPASTLLTNISLDSTASIDPLFYFILAAGFALFTISLITLYSQKHEPTQVVWQILSMGVAAGVFISWTRYESFFLSVGATALVSVSIVFAAFFMRKQLAKKYEANRIPIYLGLVLVIALPVAIAFQNTGAQPIVSISPSEPQAYLWPASSPSDNITLTIVASQADANHVTLTAKANTNTLVIYLDGKVAPHEFYHTLRANEYFCTMQIKPLQGVQEMTLYNATLTVTYSNVMEQPMETQTYQYPIYTGPPPAGPPPELTNYWLYGSVIFSVAEAVFYFFKVRK